MMSKRCDLQVVTINGDAEDRYISTLVQNVYDQEILLTNVYAPNIDDPQFLAQLISCTITNCPVHVIGGGIGGSGGVLRSEEKLLRRQKIVKYLSYFLNKGRHVTPTFRVVFGGNCNCVVRIGHLWGWEAHSNILLHNFLCITLGI